MRVICAAVVDEPRQFNNLCNCVQILGGIPSITGGKTVCVEYEGRSPEAEKFIELFNHYTKHEIRRQY